jgi:uncharacterized BrkB/YihY/UPF0761 family membrane protein
MEHRGFDTLKYLMRTEVHTYAFSVAANAILSFFPFIVLLMTLTKRVFRSEAMYDVVVLLLRDFLPTGQEFIVRNLNALVNARKGVWGIPQNRSYLGNQLISLLLAFAVGALALTSIALTAGNHVLIDRFFGENNPLQRTLTFVVMKIFAIAASVSIFFLVYWLLPNGKIAVRTVLPAAIATGILWEAAKYLYILALPWLDFQEVYGPFAISVTLMFWAFLSGMLLLGGAFLSADRELARQVDEPGA